MLAPISSAPVATVCRFWLTACAAFETTSAWADVSSELAVICWLVWNQFLAGAGYLHRIFRDRQDHAFQAATHLIDGGGQVAQFVLAADLQIVARQVACRDGLRLD